MKITIDLDKNTIEILENVNILELVEKLKVLNIDISKFTLISKRNVDVCKGISDNKGLQAKNYPTVKPYEVVYPKEIKEWYNPDYPYKVTCHKTNDVYLLLKPTITSKTE